MTRPSKKRIASDAVYRLAIEDTGQTVSAPSGTLILDALRSAGIDIHADCGGIGKCGQCRVVVSGKDVPAHEPAERKHLAPAEQGQGVRLACCTTVTCDMQVRLPQKSVSRGIQLQLDGQAFERVVDPAVRPVQITSPHTHREDAALEMGRIVRALEQGQGIGASMSHRFNADRLDKSARTRTACLRDREVVAVIEAPAKPVGLAVDVGTTKIAGYLMDLTTGDTLAKRGMLNPQSRFGADIMTRLQHAATREGRKELVQAVRRGINTLARRITDAAQIDPCQVVDACIVANTAMSHLLLDLPVGQLIRAPYTPASLEGFDMKAKAMGLSIAPEAYVHIPPAIGGFVGADHVSMIMAAGIDQADQVAIALDIGTNTEIVLKRPDSDRLYCLSCASGPAFEGAHVSNGMRAATGAIEEIRLTNTLAPATITIGGAPPIGLCGSAMIDAVSELRRCGLINDRGRFRDDIRLHGNKFLVVPKAESGTGDAIWFSQKDIDEILMAKGAIRAGIDMLLQVSQTRPDEVKQVFIAGAFGTYINLTNAVHIGLIPNFPAAIHNQIGNAAGVGAQLSLLDRNARRRTKRIAGDAKHVELIRQPDFKRHFARGMMLPQGETDT